LKIVPLGQRKEDCLLPSSHTWKTYKKRKKNLIKHETTVVGTGAPSKPTLLPPPAEPLPAIKEKKD
jgi:hypothetical protein